MNYLSVCSGIEAASVAWHDMGWNPVGFSEIEPFPCSVLAQRFPSVPNFGDLNEQASWPVEVGAADIVVGGTPCQSFSVAGQRAGLTDSRGRVMLSYLELVERIQPRWVVWENVPGVLSSSNGEDFGCFIQSLADMGYWTNWRVLDAQWFGVPQRRRRVFVVASLGDNRAAQVLFERESVCGDSSALRAQREVYSSAAQGGTNGNRITSHEVAPCLETTCNDYSRADGFTMVVDNLQPFTKSRRAQSNTDDETWVHGQISPTLSLFDQGDKRATTVAVSPDMTVRRLTPIECERLQGFPDNWTLVQHRNKPAADGPRYKALGNSMAVPVMRWIGKRIQQVDKSLSA